MIDQTSQFFAILTNIGLAKQANADALGIAWKITQMGVGDANGTEPMPSATQTALINERRRAPLNQLKVDPTNSAIIIAEQVIPEDVGGWWIREIGLYDADGDLVAIANCAPSFKPLLTQGSGRTQVVRMNMIVSNASNVELKIDPSVVLATRAYVDAKVLEELNKLDSKQSVRVATTANIALTGLQTIDAVALVAGDRVLVKNQTLAKDNGIYVAAAAVWTRASDADTNAEVTSALLVSVEQGSTLADTRWQLITDGAIVLGTTALTFQNITQGFAPINSPALLGTPTAPTAVAGTNTTQVATTAFVAAVQTLLNTALGLKAPLASPALTGVPTAPTAAPGTNSTQVATTAFIQAALAALVNSSPATLDTLNELAAALGNDANFATTMASALGLKAPLASPVLTGDPKAPTPATGDKDTSVATSAFVHNTLESFGMGGGTAVQVASAATPTEIAALPAGNYYYPPASSPYPDFAFTQRFKYQSTRGFELANIPYTDRFFGRASNSDGVWRAPVELAKLDSPAFAGTPTTPTPAINTGGQQVVNQDYVRAWTRKFIGAGVGGLGAAYTVNANQVGMWFNITTPGALITLPATDTVPSGSTFLFRNISGNSSVTLSSTSTFSAETTGVTLILAPYETVEVTASGPSYVVINRGSMALGARIDSPALTGNPTAPTPAVGDNDTSIATTAFVQAALAALINSSPSTLDTLNELALALGNDPNFATTMVNALGLKAPLASPAFTGTPTVPTAAPGANTTQAASTAFVAALGALKANLASPAFTGAPTAPNPATGLRSTAIATMQKFTDEFGASIGTNGYQRFPTGIILQWGSAGVPANGGTTVYLPIAFPTAAVSVVVSDQASSQVSVEPMGGQFIDNSSFQAWYKSATAGTFYWLAIGY